MTALGAVVYETLLGVLLIGGLRLRGWTLRATAAMLVGFTGLIAYA